MQVAITRALVVAFVLAGAVPATAQQVTPPPGNERPVIGLVFSGGGARGGAHLGVLKALARALARRSAASMRAA